MGDAEVIYALAASLEAHDVAVEELEMMKKLAGCEVNAKYVEEWARMTQVLDNGISMIQKILEDLQSIAIPKLADLQEIRETELAGCKKNDGVCGLTVQARRKLQRLAGL